MTPFASVFDCGTIFFSDYEEESFVIHSLAWLCAAAFPFILTHRISCASHNQASRDPPSFPVLGGELERSRLPRDGGLSLSPSQRIVLAVRTEPRGTCLSTLSSVL